MTYAHGYEKQVSGIPILQPRVFHGEVDDVDLSGQCFDIVVFLMSLKFLAWSIDRKHSVMSLLFF